MGGRFTVYKSKGALQANLQPARQSEENKFDVVKGAVWMTVASGSNREWDWSKKITMKLGLADIQTICSSKQVDLVHKSDKDGSIRSLKVQPGQDSGWQFLVRGPLGETSESGSIVLYLNDGEYWSFRKLLGDSIQDIIGWRL